MNSSTGSPLVPRALDLAEERIVHGLREVHMGCERSTPTTSAPIAGASFRTLNREPARGAAVRKSFIRFS